MSSPTLVLLAGVAAALSAVTACSATSEGRAPPRTPTESGAWPSGTAPSGTAEPVYSPPAAPTSPPAAAVPVTLPPAERARARAVALAEARAVCNFEWRQSLAERVAASRRHATTAYAETLAPTSDDVSNWRRTQQDRESGTCTAPSVFVVSTAPNSATVQFERVRMQQQVSVPGQQPRVQAFVALYRVERQYDGRWLVGAEGDGG